MWRNYVCRSMKAYVGFPKRKYTLPIQHQRQSVLFLGQIWRWSLSLGLPYEGMPCFPVFEDNQGVLLLSQNQGVVLLSNSNSKYIGDISQYMLLLNTNMQI